MNAPCLHCPRSFPASFTWPWRLSLAAVMLITVALLTACKNESVVAQAPVAPVLDVPADARGHYCGMFLTEHVGPKGQVRVRDVAAPLWFTSIREIFSFLAAPDEPKAVTGVYVQDMSRRRADGSFPPEAWIDARSAWYVIGSGAQDFPAADDAMPFATQADAEAYRARHGGTVVTFATMTQAFVSAGSGASPAGDGASMGGTSS